MRHLATKLRADGIDVRADLWHLRGRTFAEFMNAEVREADRILILLSPTYREKVHAMEEGGHVRGTGWESMLVTAAMCANQRSRNTIHCALMAGDWADAAPSWLSGVSFYDLRSRAAIEGNYLDLIRDLKGESSIPPIGDESAGASDSGQHLGASSATSAAVMTAESLTELRVTLKPGVGPDEFLPLLAQLASLTGKIQIIERKPRRRS